MRGASPVVIGALCAVGAALFFSVNDMAVKVLSGGYPLHQVIFTRSAIGITFMAALVMPFAGGTALLRTRQAGWHMLRGFLVFFTNMSYFLALSAMPIADATAIFYVSPVMIALFSIAFLGEKVGPRRWLAITVGLVGALVMIRPGSESFSPVALLPLVAAAGYAGLHTLTRKLGATESAVTMAFYLQVAFLLFSSGFGLAFGDGRLDPQDGTAWSFLLRGWIWPEGRDWLVFSLAGLGTAAAGVLIAQAYRLCEAALVAPIEYIGLPMAIFWGLIIFGEWPDTYGWSGIALILISGLYMLFRETRSMRLS